MKYYIIGILCVTVLVLYIYKHRNSSDCRVLRTIRTEDGTIEIVDAACQEGLPHTTDSHTIRMTETAYASKRRDRTLAHERIHLDQKRNPDIWRKFYKDHWDYELYDTPPRDLPATYIKNLRPNPDTSDAPWALWRSRWLFFPNYGTDRTLRNARVLIWDTHTKQIVMPPPEWKAIFCVSDSCPHQFEHPHELSAEYIAEGGNSPAALKLFAWKH
jgi:hypothetical protein